MVTGHDDHSPGTKRFRVIDLVIPADAEATLPYLVEAVRRLIPADRKAAMAARGESGRAQTPPSISLGKCTPATTRFSPYRPTIAAQTQASSSTSTSRSRSGYWFPVGR
jgi:hypothetical protein